jgi:hypothetical protein
MRPLLSLVTGALIIGVQPGPFMPQAQIVQSAPVKHTFTATIHYVYRSRQYHPPVPVVYLEQAPAKSDMPETALISQLSALHKGDYAWWMATWDRRSREKLELQQQQSGQSDEVWLKARRDRDGSGQCVLTTWILRKQYIVLRYRCSGSNAQKNGGVSHAVTFRVHGGRFEATLDLEKDPIFSHADGTNVDLEIKPRD